VLPSSYRDPAGFVVNVGGLFRRVVTTYGLKDYERYISSGLHGRLVASKQIVDHEEEPSFAASRPDWVKVLTPEQIVFISYPYEWSFDELKDAALLTLDVQETALAHGMSLKDASPFNVQFRGPRPVFIDTLSFEINAGGPWIAYEQFCRQFLSPLLLMSYGWPEASRYLRVDLNGFPLEYASRLLPTRSYGRLGALLHVHLHARSARNGRNIPPDSRSRGSDTKAGLAQSLRNSVEKLPRPGSDSAWSTYYQDARFYSVKAQKSKQSAVGRFAGGLKPRLIYDLGANTGLFARALSGEGTLCVAFERDANCVNRLYLEERGNDASHVLPLVMDLDNPSPGLGFGLDSTLSITERPQADLVLCLALIHHLRFSANIPLRKIARFASRLGRWLLVEFVPRDDPAAQLLVHGREGFDDYTSDAFVDAFSEPCCLRDQTAIEDSSRRLYLFERRT
jgi:hypothetical protein